MNAWVLGKGLELLGMNVGKFEIRQLLFADDTALVADLVEKLYGLASEFRRVMRVNGCKNKVMGCSRYGYGG